MEVKRDREENNGSKGIGIEDEGEISHSTCHGFFAHNHQAHLSKLC